MKKYHPDKYQNNPLSDLAEEKLQEVNEAYDMLMGKNQGNSGYRNKVPATAGQTVRRSLTRSEETLIWGTCRARKRFSIAVKTVMLSGCFFPGMLSSPEGLV